MTAILGYARVSTTGQDLTVQQTTLMAAGVDPAQIFADELSGAVGSVRPGLAALLSYARTGDTVVVTAIDRLGRSAAEVTRTIADLDGRQVLLRALREGVDTATPTGRAVAAIMATLAELELELGRERRAASRQSRRSRQLPPTKPQKLSAERQEQLRRLAALENPFRNLRRRSGSVELLPTVTFRGPHNDGLDVDGLSRSLARPLGSSAAAEGGLHKR